MKAVTTIGIKLNHIFADSNLLTAPNAARHFLEEIV